MFVEIFLYSALVPAVVAGTIMLTTRRAGVAVAAAFGIAWLFEMSWTWPDFPAPDSKSALGLPVLVAGVVALIPRARMILLLIPAFGMAFYVMSTKRAFAPALVGATLTVAWATLAYINAIRRPGGAVPFAWMVGLVIASGAFPLLGYAAGGQFLGSLAAACGALMVVAAWRKTDVALAALPLSVALYGILLNGHLFIYPDVLPLSSAVLFGLAPLAAWIGELAWFRGKPWWMDWGARAGAVAVVAILGLALAYASIPEEEAGAPQESNPYYD
jgi:hypothetical protein